MQATLSLQKSTESEIRNLEMQIDQLAMQMAENPLEPLWPILRTIPRRSAR